MNHAVCTLADAGRLVRGITEIPPPNELIPLLRLLQERAELEDDGTGPFFRLQEPAAGAPTADEIRRSAERWAARHSLTAQKRFRGLYQRHLLQRHLEEANQTEAGSTAFERWQEEWTTNRQAARPSKSGAAPPLRLAFLVDILGMNRREHPEWRRVEYRLRMDYQLAEMLGIKGEIDKANDRRRRFKFEPLLEKGRQAAASDGRWPWALFGDGQLPEAWRADPKVLRALADAKVLTQ